MRWPEIPRRILRRPATSPAHDQQFFAEPALQQGCISYDIKSDYTITEKDHLSGRFSHQTINTYQAPLFGSFLGARRQRRI